MLATARGNRSCDGLVNAGYRVIRYDNRDIGLSTHLHGAPAISPVWAVIAKRLNLPAPIAYTLEDMAGDATALMDALGIDAAHIVGASMGGMIAQLIAVRAPARVLSLTSIMSSSGAPGLPGPSPEIRRRLLAKRPAKPTRAQAAASGAESLRVISYPDPARAPDAFHDIAGRAFDRSYNPMGMRRQLLAIIDDGDRSSRLATIAAPTLVIHGADDRLVPVACSSDIAARIPGARLVVVDAMAHDLPPSQIPRLVGLITDHARAATVVPVTA
jgi:pimeloyl-ACP methyl ester carboxylesterase